MQEKKKTHWPGGIHCLVQRAKTPGVFPEKNHFGSHEIAGTEPENKKNLLENLEKKQSLISVTKVPNLPAPKGEGKSATPKP